MPAHTSGKPVAMQDPISKIQIQTVDTCNAACIMCPHKSLPHTRKLISDELFVKIIHEIQTGIQKNWIVPVPQIFLFLHNEPLCDPRLLDRVEYIKNILPESFIQIYTNGISLKKYTSAILASRLDYVYLSMYGYDHLSYNKIAGTRISQKMFDGIYEAINKIGEKKRVKIAKCWRNEEKEPSLFEYSSRAGFYTEKIYVDHILGCAHSRIDRWLNFFADGQMPLCCMDWRREAILGDISKQSLEEVLNSEQYHTIKQKAHGIIPSEENFICKRCDWTIARKENTVRRGNRSKRLIITSASANKVDYLLDFVISLRTLGRYRDEILLIDYGLPETIRVLMQSFGVTIHRMQEPDQRKMIVNTRLIDIYTILRQFYAGKILLAIYDVDVWFQDDINPLFADIRDADGCLYAAEFRPGFFEFGHGRGPADPSIRERDLARMTEVVKELDGHINAGLMGGTNDKIYKKIEKIIQKNREGYLLSTYGIDQYLYNLLFEIGKDRADMKRFNAVLNDVMLDEGIVRIKKHKPLVVDHKIGKYEYTEHPGEKAVAIHTYNVFSEARQAPFRFRSLYPEIFNQTMEDQIATLSSEVINKMNLYINEERKTTSAK
jgi:molybdenum cofactor biosynthesis enzyme MoaA